MNFRRRILLGVAAATTAASGALFLHATPASAQACVEGRVWVDGQVTRVGGCQPIFDEWENPCAGGDVFPLGNGAGATACLPTPV